MLVEKIIDEKSFFSLSERWDLLLEKSAFKSVFLSWRWQKTWWREFRDNRTLYVLLAKDQAGNIAGIAPFFSEQTRAGKSLLRVIGDNDISDHICILAEKGREKEICGAIAQYLAGDADRWDELNLGPLKQEVPSCSHLVAEAASIGLEVEKSICDTSPSINLPGAWDDFLKGLARKERHELRRKLRKAEREASLKYYVCEDKASLDADMEAFFTLMEKSSPEKAAFLKNDMRRFFKRVAAELFEAGWLDLSFLDVNQARVAANLCFDYCGSLQLYNSGFDPNYRHLSTGIVLTADNLRRAIEKGRSRFDFLRGDEDYKYRLGGEDEPLYRVRIKKKA